MLASLRPSSPPQLSSSSSNYRAYNHRESFTMVSPTSKYHPPSPGSSRQLLPTTHDAHDRRPSQSRQRSWHHPYAAPTNRMPYGLVPSAQEQVHAGTNHFVDSAPYEAHLRPYPRRASPTPNPADYFHGAPDYPNQLSSAQPTRSVQEGERVGHIGPSRNRGRSNTLSLPNHDANRGRADSFASAARVHSPIQRAHNHTANYTAHDAISLPPRSWDEYRNRRESLLTRTGDGPASSGTSPAFSANSRTPPLLFAPLSPDQDAHMPNVRRISGGQGHLSGVTGSAPRSARASSLRSRPGTPISPLNMADLSMEDNYVPSASGMAIPLQQQQRSPYDSRGRDYFGPAASERPRGFEGGRSPNTHPSALGRRYNPREYTPHPSPYPLPSPGLYPGEQQARYPPPAPSMGSGQSRLISGQSSLPSQIHPSPEHYERERLATAHAQAQAQRGYPPPLSPADYSYQGDYMHSSRMGSGNPSAGALTQQPPIDRIAHSRKRRRPPYSYSSMITQAIASTPEGRMTLREIYTWISSNFTGYPMSGPDSQGWQNTVRHNLSLGKIFIKKARTAQDIYDSCSSGNPSQNQAARGKGGWWTLHPVVLSQIRSGQRTHNDEFDDVERLVEIEAASTSAASSGSASVAGKATDAQHEATGESVRARSLTRQRSYSDSVDPNAGSHRHALGAHRNSTAPVSREGSIRGGRPAPANGAVTRHPFSSAPISADDQGGDGSDHLRREGLPSVLQPRNDMERQGSSTGRSRGHTIATNELPSRPMHALGPDGHRRWEESSDHLRADSFAQAPVYAGAVGGPFDGADDVEMEAQTASGGHLVKPSQFVLQDARDVLTATKKTQLKKLGHPNTAASSANASDDLKEGSGRMAIRDLLNS